MVRSLVSTNGWPEPSGLCSGPHEALRAEPDVSPWRAWFSGTQEMLKVAPGECEGGAQGPLVLALA